MAAKKVYDSNMFSPLEGAQQTAGVMKQHLICLKQFLFLISEMFFMFLFDWCVINIVPFTNPEK